MPEALGTQSSRKSGITACARLVHVAAWLWGKLWLVVFAWFSCAIFLVWCLKHSKQKTLLTALANLIVGWPLFSLVSSVQGGSISNGHVRLLRHWRKVLFIGILAGLEKNLANFTLYRIGPSMKTALHGFNVVFTFLAAALFGVDQVGHRCIFRCYCKGKLVVALAIALAAGGGVATICFKDPTDSSGEESRIGEMVQLCCSFCYALKFTSMKILLGEVDIRGGVYCDSRALPPTAVELSSALCFTTGLISFVAVGLVCPFTKNCGELTIVDIRVSGLVGIAVSLVVLFELRLTKLTSPLTVAILGTLQDIVIVVFFWKYDGGTHFEPSQLIGYFVSIVGVLMYICSMHRSHAPFEHDACHSFGSSIEETAPEGIQISMR